MYIWNTLTGWIPSPCCGGGGRSTPRNTNNDSNSRTELGRTTDEETPLLTTSTNTTTTNEEEGPSLTSGYTDYLHSSSALRLVVVHGLLYYTLAVVLYSVVLDTKWTVIDSLYFATVLFTTIGYGDFSPLTDVGRVCTMGLALYGIVMLGIFLGIYGETLLEHHTSSTTEQHTTVRKTVVEAMVQTTQDARNNSNNSSNSNSSSLRPATSSSHATTNGGAVPAPAPAPAAAVSPWGATKPKTKLQTVISGELLQMADDNTQQGVINNNNNTNTTTDNQQVLEHLQKNQQTLLQDIVVLIFDELPILTFVSLIGLAIGQIEGWDLIKSAYWTIISGTTVGFGDEAPENEYVRLACVVFLPLCVAVLGEILSKIADLYLSRKRRISLQEFFSRSLTKADLVTMDTDCNGDVSQAEFLSYMLVALQLVDQTDIDEINDLFQTLDKDKTGVLHQADLELLNWDESMTRSIAQVALSQQDESLSLRSSRTQTTMGSPGTTSIRDIAVRWAGMAHHHSSRRQTIAGSTSSSSSPSQQQGNGHATAASTVQMSRSTSGP